MRRILVRGKDEGDRFFSQLVSTSFHRTTTMTFEVARAYKEKIGRDRDRRRKVRRDWTISRRWNLSLQPEIHTMYEEEEDNKRNRSLKLSCQAARGARLIRVKSVSWFRSCYLPIHRSISYFSTEARWILEIFRVQRQNLLLNFFLSLFFFAIHDLIKIWYFRMDN